MSVIKKGFSKSRQEDTHEFFRFVTDALQNTALCGLPKYAVLFIRMSLR
jgi:ubiquitin C-terminal hydrolase